MTAAAFNIIWLRPVHKGLRPERIGLSVEVKRGPSTLVSSLKTFNSSETLKEVLDSFSLELEAAVVIKAEAADRPSGPWRQVGLHETVGMLASFNDMFVSSTSLCLNFELSGAREKLMMLHCIESANEGGESLLSDGFKAAEELKQEHPEAFKLLASTIFECFDKGYSTDYHGKYHTVARHPVISLDQQGKISQVVLADHSRTPLMRVSVSQVTPIYQALRLFEDKLHDPANMLQFKLKEGEIICLNNYRVLHGRADFKVTKTTNRHLEGAYLDWDQMNICMRVIQEEMHANTSSQNNNNGKI